MKKVYQFVLIFCVAIILFAGFLLPQLLTSYIDNGMESKNVQSEIEEVYLTFSTSYIKTLDLFGAQHTTIEYTGNTSLTDQNAITIAIQFAMSMPGIWDGFETNPAFDYAYPLLVTTEEEPSRKGVFWCVVWTQDEENAAKVWVDDKSGKIVALEAVPISVEYKDDFVYIAEELSDRFLEEALLTSSAKATDQPEKNIVEITITSPNGDLEETYTFQILMKNGLLYVNK